MARSVASVFRPGLFKNKSAIVTGGGSGIGLAITQELLYLGCNVMIASRKLDRLVEAKEHLTASLSAGNRLEYTQCNVRNEDQVKSLVSETISKFGKLDYLVNNGGGQFFSPAADISKKGWHAVVETNLDGTFHLCQAAYHQWMKEHGGVIISIIVDMWKGMPGMCPSGAARAGVENMMKTLSVEWASCGIRLNSVCPGSSIYSDTAAKNYGSLKVFEGQIPRIPAKRLGKPEEVSAAVCFLLSPAAAFISGDTIQVDGAHTLYNTHLPWPIEDHKRFPTFTWEEQGERQKKIDEELEDLAKSKL